MKIKEQQYKYYFTKEEIEKKYKVDSRLVRKVSHLTESVSLKGKMHYNIKSPKFKSLLKYGQQGVVTKGEAKKDYKLKDRDFEKLSCMEVKNPHYACAAPMKLYFVKEIFLKQAITVH